MIRPTSIIVLLSCPWLFGDSAISQTASQLRHSQLQGALDIQNARIGEQRVQRQSEIMRLEQTLETLEDRVKRLERRSIANSQPPLITIAEAEAGVEFTLARLRESEKLHEEGELTDVTLARHRLDHLRAEAQLDTAKFAHADRLIALELEVLYNERSLAERTQQLRHLERLVAKGYSSPDGLKQSVFDVAIAEKQVEKARLRLELQRRSTGDSTAQTLLKLDVDKDDNSPGIPATPPGSSQRQ